MKQPRPDGSTRGFSRAATLMSKDVRSATEARGFSESRLLTHWEEIVGSDVAEVCWPVKVSYARQGLGASLVVLTKGAHAPMLEMHKEKIREKVNAVYGYSAISRISLTQTAPTGFAEGQASFRPRKPEAQQPDPEARNIAKDMTKDVTDERLRLALEALGANVLTKQSKPKSRETK